MDVNLREFHPQASELTEALENFLRQPDLGLEVHCPEKKISVDFRAEHVLARPKRSLGAISRQRFFVSGPAPEKMIPQRRAEAVGFEPVERVIRNPFGGKDSIAKSLRAEFLSADEGADWCLAMLQQVHESGYAWLWITTEQYDDWPHPLPIPSTWPPDDWKPGA